MLKPSLKSSPPVALAATTPIKRRAKSTRLQQQDFKKRKGETLALKSKFQQEELEASSGDDAEGENEDQEDYVEEDSGDAQDE